MNGAVSIKCINPQQKIVPDLLPFSCFLFLKHKIYIFQQEAVGSQRRIEQGLSPPSELKMKISTT